jgi:hypothetical protein
MSEFPGLNMSKPKCSLVNLKSDGRATDSMATIRDRVVQGAVWLILEPIFEAVLYDNTYGVLTKTELCGSDVWCNRGSYV